MIYRILSRPLAELSPACSCDCRHVYLQCLMSAAASLQGGDTPVSVASLSQCA